MPSPATPVVPSIPLTAEMERIAAFSPGTWNGVTYSKQFVHDLYANFQRYSTGANPWYVPYINVNHNDELKTGRIGKATMEGDTLYLWADQIPMQLASVIKSKMLNTQSVEFIEPKVVNGQVRGFVGPDGKIVQGPVLKCLSLLGNEVPAVKGLPPLPEPKVSKFRDTGGRTVRFSLTQGGKMNPDLLNKLQQMGFNVALLPADATDDLLNEIIKLTQSLNANPAPNTVTTNADPTAVPAVPQTVPSPQVPGTNPATTLAMPTMGNGAMPEQIVMKFRQELGGMVAAAVAPLNLQLKGLAGQLGTINANAAKQLAAGRDEIVRRFLDEMGTSGQVSPAMRPGVEAMLKTLDHQVVRKFADGKTDGSALDEAMAGIRNTYPKQRTAPGNGNPTVRQPAVNPPANTGTSRPDVVARVMGATPEGRAALKRQTAAAK